VHKFIKDHLRQAKTLTWKTDPILYQKRQAGWHISATNEQRTKLLKTAADIASIVLQGRGSHKGNKTEVALAGGLDFDRGWLDAVKLKHVNDPETKVITTWIDYRWFPQQNTGRK
jgi:hypothetical protein